MLSALQQYRRLTDTIGTSVCKHGTDISSELGNCSIGL